MGFKRDDCIFCRIIKGEIPSAKVYDDDEFVSFLDISPANKGHALVVPKKHYSSSFDMPDEYAGKMMKIANKVSKAIVEAVQPGGLNLLLNNGKAAGQEVNHVHLHIMPRYSSDDFQLSWTHKGYDEGEMDKFAKDIKEQIRD